ncbi:MULTISPECIES: LysE family translocator [unclassified Haladaptatus]|nr:MULTISPECIES: LysE family transporter [unclassified Haladaptatus]
MSTAMETFGLGLVFGVSIAAPVGPIGILCIQRTLERGFPSGFVSGLGAATADALYGALVAFGATVVAAVLVTHAAALRLGGGLLLVALGVQTARRAPAARPAGVPTGTSLARDYATTLALTLGNPATILAFAAVVTGFGVAVGSVVEAGALVAGVFTGSVGWWLFLAGVVSRIRDRVTAQWLKRVNVIAGVVLVGFGVVALSGLF